MVILVIMVIRFIIVIRVIRVIDISAFLSIGAGNAYQYTPIVCRQWGGANNVYDPNEHNNPKYA